MDEVKVVNLTPHAITVVVSAEETVVYPPSGQVARVSVTNERVATLNGNIPLFRAVYGEVVGLPPAETGVVYLVSAMLRGAVPARLDLVSPADLLRDDKGQPLGTNGFATNLSAQPLPVFFGRYGQEGDAR